MTAPGISLQAAVLQARDTSRFCSRRARMAVPGASKRAALLLVQAAWTSFGGRDRLAALPWDEDTCVEATRSG